MPVIGVRELRERTLEILRAIREEGAEYLVAESGELVARLIPVLPARENKIETASLDPRQSRTNGPWEAYALLAEKIRVEWQKGYTTEDLLDGLRR